MLHVTRVGRKPEHETCVFPCKVAAAGDEGQLLCEAGAAWIVYSLLLKMAQSK